MLLRKRIHNPTLFTTGAGMTALSIVLRRLIDRAGKSTDTTDFLVGLLVGVGLGCLLLFVWKVSRRYSAHRAR